MESSWFHPTWLLGLQECRWPSKPIGLLLLPTWRCKSLFQLEFVEIQIRLAHFQAFWLKWFEVSQKLRACVLLFKVSVLMNNMVQGVVLSHQAPPDLGGVRFLRMAHIRLAGELPFWRFDLHLEYCSRRNLYVLLFKIFQFCNWNCFEISLYTLSNTELAEILKTKVL